MNNNEIITQLKSQSTWRLIFLGILTLGIYTVYYIKRQTRILNKHLDSKQQISEGFVKTILILAYVNTILLLPYCLVNAGHPIGLIREVLDYVLNFLILIWAFKARNRINMLIAGTKSQQYWFSGFWTFIFSFLYFNYKINKLNNNFTEQEKS